MSKVQLPSRYSRLLSLRPQISVSPDDIKRIVAIFISVILISLIELWAEQCIQANRLPNFAQPLLSEFGKPAAMDGVGEQAVATKILNRLWYIDPNGYPVPKDFSSEYINYKGGYRATIGQPIIYSRTIWLVGSSSTVNEDLSDKDTIASQLQALVPSMRVINASMSGANIGQIEARVNHLPIQRGDIVIVFSGSVEGYETWYAANVDRGSRITDGLCNFLLRHPFGITLLMCWQEITNVPGLYDERLYDYAHSIYDPYMSTTERLTKESQAKGATLINVLTPFCSCSEWQDYPGVGRAYIAFYALARQDKAIFDFSQIVEERDFFSTFHVNAHGARIVAQALYEVIKQ